MTKYIFLSIFLFLFASLDGVSAFDGKYAQALTYEVINHADDGNVELGTAVAVSKDGKLVTALHVINNYQTITVRSSEGREYNASVKGISTKNDLALLQIDAKNIPYADVSNKKSLNQRVYVLSGEGLLVRGNIAQIKSDGILIDIDTKQGSSGGGVFDEKNNLLGIVLHKENLRDIFYAASSTLLKTVNEPYSPTINKKEISMTGNYDTSYCHDSEDIATWAKLSKSPNLGVQELHALYIGLCKKVENHDLTTDQAQYIFEKARLRVLDQ